MGLVNDKDKFEKDIKDTLEDVHEPVVSATLAEKPRYSLRLVDKEDIDVDDDYVFAKIEEKIEKKYRYYNLKEDDKLLAKVSTKEEKDKLIIDGIPHLKTGVSLYTYGDHRIAMALIALCLKLKQDEYVIIEEAECCKISYPLFIQTLRQFGAKIEEC